MVVIKVIKISLFLLIHGERKRDSKETGSSLSFYEKHIREIYTSVKKKRGLIFTISRGFQINLTSAEYKEESGRSKAQSEFIFPFGIMTSAAAREREGRKKNRFNLDCNHLLDMIYSFKKGRYILYSPVFPLANKSLPFYYPAPRFSFLMFFLFLLPNSPFHFISYYLRGQIMNKRGGPGVVPLGHNNFLDFGL